MKTQRFYALGALLITSLISCSESPPTFHADTSPSRLSDWGLFNQSDQSLTPTQFNMVYRPANQLFSDYAQKLRTIWIPEGAKAQLVGDELSYPVGTVVSKTFYYPTDSAGNLQRTEEVIAESIDLSANQLIETRLLVKRSAGWEAFPYVWNDEGSEAFLRVAGTSKALKLQDAHGSSEFVYFVPNENQCSGCHVTEHPDGEMHPLGAVATQLSASFIYPDNVSSSQLDEMLARGWLDIEANVTPPPSWRDPSETLEDRALAYLSMNCGHCHNPDGAADTSNLILTGQHEQPVNMGVCKPPVAAGGGAGDRLYSIVPGKPAESILVYRMQSAKPDEMMPELGRALVHEQGVELISQWIASLPGSCS